MEYPAHHWHAWLLYGPLSLTCACMQHCNLNTERVFDYEFAACDRKNSLQWQIVIADKIDICNCYWNCGLSYLFPFLSMLFLWYCNGSACVHVVENLMAISYCKLSNRNQFLCAILNAWSTDGVQGIFPDKCSKPCKLRPRWNCRASCNPLLRKEEDKMDKWRLSHIEPFEMVLRDAIYVINDSYSNKAEKGFSITLSK